MLLIELLHNTTKQLAGFSETPRLDAELLLGEAAGFSKIAIFLRSNEEVSAEVEKKLQVMLERRIAGEPVAYILGRKEFFGLEFQVSEACLVPRPETELLVEKALEFAKSTSKSLKILDLGTGSGCIAVTISRELQKMNVPHDLVAIDKSLDALELAKNNARTLGAFEKITFLRSDWFSALREEKFDLILTNPPYIAVTDTELSRELKFEPQMALYADDEGLADMRSIVESLDRHLNVAGLFLCEIGARQSERALKLVREVLGDGYQAIIWNDLAALPRLMEVRRTLNVGNL